MKNTKNPLRLIMAMLCAAVMMIACQKENSIEKGGFNTPATGAFVDSLGFCKSITVAGEYKVDTTLNARHYVIVNVNFTVPGKYKIYSDTVNGMWFIDSGFVVTAGEHPIKLKGNGTPILNKQSDFSVFFDTHMCTFSIVSDGSPNGGNDGTGGTPSTEYFPLTPGSTWVYDFIPDLPTNPSSIDTFTVYILNDQVQRPNDPLTYYQFEARLPATPYYFAKEGATGNIYALSTPEFDYDPRIYETVPNDFISYPIIKPGANAGDTWETDEYGPVTVNVNGTVVSGKSKAKFTVVSKTATHTVGGKTYDNVINMKREILFKPDTETNYQVIVTGNSFYAKGYGMIDQIINYGSFTQNMPVYKKPTIK